MRRIGMAVLGLALGTTPLVGQRSALREVRDRGSYGGGCGCYASEDFYLDGDFTTTTSAGTGVLIQVASRRSSVAIDLGVRGVRHDRVMYVPAGGLTQNSDGTFSAQRVETPVEL